MRPEATCSDRHVFWNKLNAYLEPRDDNPDYVICTRLGNLLAMCYPDAPPCSLCGTPVFVAPAFQHRVDSGERIVCGSCHFYPGVKPSYLRKCDDG